MEWLKRIKSQAAQLAEKASLIAPGDSSAIPDEVAAFAPYRRRPYIPILVLGAVALLGIVILSEGGESKRSVSKVVAAKPATPEPPRDIRVRMRAQQKAAEARAKAQAPAEEPAPKPKATGDGVFFGKADKEPEADAPSAPEVEPGEDLVSAMKKAMAAEE